MNINETIQKIVNILKKIPIGKYSIALAGAHAKGVADKDSDIDIYMFVEEIISYEDRIKIIKDFADINHPIWVSREIDVNPWGGEINFYYENIPVEVVIRLIEKEDKIINGCLEGKFEIISATWTSNGYYTFVYLSEINFLKPLCDDYQILSNYKEKLKIYPIKLRKSIINIFYRRANTWIENFHYTSAINRCDTLFTAPIVLHTILDMIQVILAINEVYFYGDKKLLQALINLNYCPKELIDNLTLLLSANPDKDTLTKQQYILLMIRDEIAQKIGEIRFE